MSTISTVSSPRRNGLYQRLFAWMLAHSSDTYEQLSAVRKRALLGGLHGDILEIGPGSGPNLRYYRSDVRWLGVEPNIFLHPYLRQAFQTLGWPTARFTIDPGAPDGVTLPAPSASIDAVVGTLVLCSTAHPQGTLQEIRRVLKPGGRFVFIEHVAAPRGTRLRALQDFIQPLWRRAGDGCHPNRETWTLIEDAGFARVEIEHYPYPGGGLAGPHIAGVAMN